MIIQKMCLLLAIFSLSFSAYSQESTKIESAGPIQNSFYAELGGPGILFSANIDRRFSKSHLGWGGRIGLGFVSGYLEDDGTSTGFYDNPSSVLTVPFQINYIFGKKGNPHTFEVGAGVTISGKKIEVLDFYEKPTNIFGSASFMYRRQPVNGGFSWRIGFTPLIANGYIQAFGGASVGYNF
jgi:hypothetical protein